MIGSNKVMEIFGNESLTADITTFEYNANNQVIKIEYKDNAYNKKTKEIDIFTYFKLDFTYNVGDQLEKIVKTKYPTPDEYR